VAYRFNDYFCVLNEKETMNKEKNRKLSAKEQKRLNVFEETCERLSQKGYKKTDLTISIVKANLFVFLLAIPVVAIGVLLFAWKNPISLLTPTPQGSLLFVVLFLVLVVAHELIHGLTWSLYAEHHFKDIEFGFMKEYLTPYCTCTTPLLKSHYIMGALMPCVVLGIFPTAIGILLGSHLLFWTGIVMILTAGGDIMIVMKVLAYKSQNGAEEILIYDHPTQAGSVIFER
jgi:sterol desaturase/sphingolipid hydroxylase (fatty acid hydroxylase superfamily)